MEAVATHLDEPTGYFVNHWQLLERIESADKSLDQRIAVHSRAAARPPGGAGRSRRAEARRGRRRVDFDPEVAAIFTDEATELIDASEHALSDWRAQPSAQEYRLALKRPLHTLKGGARMAGIVPMGDLSHELESLVVQVDNGSVIADAALFDADPGEPRRARADARAGSHRQARGARARDDRSHPELVASRRGRRGS